jgi:hypothetical protein
MGRIRIINRIDGFMGHFHAFLSGCCYGGMWHVAWCAKARAARKTFGGSSDHVPRRP